MRKAFAEWGRRMGPEKAAIYTLMFFAFVVMPTFAGAGYLVAHLANLHLGCGA